MQKFSPAEVESMVQVLMSSGLHVSRIRVRLAEKGIHWQYEYTGGGDGERARLRRLRHLGMGLCSECHLNGYKLGKAVNVCDECLSKKYAIS